MLSHHYPAYGVRLRTLASNSAYPTPTARRGAPRARGLGSPAAFATLAARLGATPAQIALA